jgi:hypothetical protein
MLGAFIYELVLNARQQGTPISLKVRSYSTLVDTLNLMSVQPYINPMLGPSGSALINLGARFPPCMKNVADVPLTLQIGCMLDFTVAGAFSEKLTTFARHEQHAESHF